MKFSYGVIYALRKSTAITNRESCMPEETLYIFANFWGCFASVVRELSMDRDFYGLMSRSRSEHRSVEIHIGEIVHKGYLSKEQKEKERDSDGRYSRKHTIDLFQNKLKILSFWLCDAEKSIKFMMPSFCFCDAVYTSINFILKEV